jgi:hypothetical protein
MSRSLSLFPVAPTWSAAHPWNASFHFSLVNPRTVGRTPRTGIGPSQGRYLYTEQHKHRINAHNTDIHPLSRIRTHDPAFERAKTVHALDSAAIVIGMPQSIPSKSSNVLPIRRCIV